MAHLAKQALQERETEVKREDLLKTLIENREKHVKLYHEALAGYKAAAAQKLREDGEKARHQLEKNLKHVAAEIEEFDPERPSRFGDHVVLIQQVVMTMPVPKCYAAAYDAAIDMARWDVNPTMKLSFAEFNCFVRDQWDWKSDFTETALHYTKSL